MTYRVLLAIDQLVYEGAERQFALTAANLPERWEVRCFSAEGGPFAEYLTERGVWLKVAERRWRYDPLPFLRMGAIVARWRPHVVHSWGYMTTLAGSPIFRTLGIPYIDAFIRTGDIDLYRASRRTTGMDKATLVAANTRSGLVAAGIPPERGRVVPNGFDFSRIPTAPTRADNPPATAPQGDDSLPAAAPAPADNPPATALRADRRFTVVMTGRMDGIKDFPSLFAAARLLAAEAGAGNVHFVALGKGPDMAALEAEAADLVEAGVLEFGYSTDVISDLLGADCGVLMTRPPKLEGCSNSILEYMACGLPVVASRGGGTDELVADGETGFLVGPSDSGDLAARLRWIYNNRVAAREMGARGARLVRERHSVETMIRVTEELYREAMALGRRR